jgi:hypothetical protein
MRKDWHGLIKVLEIEHVRNGKVIWQDRNLYNTLHTLGEQFLLSCCFVNPGNVVPANYFLGLDNRTVLDVNDAMTDLIDEPSGNGYLRQSISSSTGFTLQLNNGIYEALTQIVSFTAHGGSWGPVQSMFLATTSDNTGVLVASVPLSQPATLQDGDAVNMRMSLSLQDAG